MMYLPPSVSLTRCVRTLGPGVVDAVDGAAELVGLEGADELAGLRVEALHAPVLPVGIDHHYVESLSIDFYYNDCYLSATHTSCLSSASASECGTLNAVGAEEKLKPEKSALPI